MAAKIDPTERKSTALVLAGGGARGAYEVGVLSYLYHELAQRQGVRVGFDIFAGTSVGAINVSFLAASADRQIDAATSLEDFWRDLKMSRVFRFSARELTQLLILIAGGQWHLENLRPGRRPKAQAHPPVAGLFDTSLLLQDLQERVPWEQLQVHLQSGEVSGMALVATEVCTGKSIIFHQSNQAEFGIPTHPGREGRAVQFSAEHALASASIPFLFPAVQIESVCYVDGALHHNTPLKPALRLGAEKALVISLNQDPAMGDYQARLSCRRNPYPGVLFLLGRLVHAISAATLDYDLRRVELFNGLLTSGTQIYGSDFVDNLNQATKKVRQTEYRFVRTCHIRPSSNLNDLAVDAVRQAPKELRLAGSGGPAIQRVLVSGPLVESELTSYVMFTPTYIKKLIDLGWSDAQQHRDELVEFFEED